MDGDLDRVSGNQLTMTVQNQQRLVQRVVVGQLAQDLTSTQHAVVLSER